MDFALSFGLLGMITIALGSFSIGLDTGVLIAGRADGRGTPYHLVGSGIWGGCFSLLAGIMTMMAESRLNPQLPGNENKKKEKMTFSHRFHVAPFYRPFFHALFTFSLLGFCSAIVTICISSALINSTSSFCNYQDVKQLWLYFELFCYGGVASIILIPTALLLVPLHLIMIIFCLRTVLQPEWKGSDSLEDQERLHGRSSSGTPSVGSLTQIVTQTAAAVKRSFIRDDDDEDSPNFDGKLTFVEGSTNVPGADRQFQFEPTKSRPRPRPSTMTQSLRHPALARLTPDFNRSISAAAPSLHGNSPISANHPPVSHGLTDQRTFPQN